MKTWEQVAETISYKPNVRLRVVDNIVQISVMTTDAYHPQDPTPVIIGHKIPLPDFPPPDERYMVDRLRDCIRRMEMHESDEWFRVNGIMLRNPHEVRGS